MKHILLCCLIFFTMTFSYGQPCTPNPFSLSFNGTSSHITINNPNALDITGTITVEAWIYATQWAFSTYAGSIVSKDGWSAGEFGYVIRAGGSGQLSFVIGTVDPSGTPVSWQEALSSPGALSLNTWYHVAGTFDGNVVKLYLNGQVVGNKSFTGTILTSAGFPMRIGMFCDTAYGTRYWNGLIDEVRVWSIARTQTELQANMGTHLDTSLAQTGLEGYWRFNEGFGTVMHDISSNNNNGSVFSCGPSTVVPFNATLPQPPLISYSGGILTCSAFGVVDSYQWYFNGSIIPNATLQTYSPSQYGSYTVKITAPNGCSAISPAFNYNTTGISFVNNNNITVSPIPARERLEITSNMGIRQVRLYDLSGREIMSVNTDGAFHYMLNLGDLQAGMYILKGNNSNSEWVKKIIISD